MIEKYHLVGNIFMYVKIRTIGNRVILKNEEAKELYISSLNSSLEMYEVTIISYVIMHDSVHLIIHGEDSETIYNFLQYVEKSFARKYFTNYTRVVKLFENQKIYKSLLDENDIFRYISLIHKIPVYRKYVKKEEEYIYSSYNDYLKQNRLITKKAINLVFKNRELNVSKFLKIDHKGLKEIYDMDNLKNIINHFLKKSKITKYRLQYDVVEMKRLLSYMITLGCRFSKHSIAEALDISKASFYRYTTDRNYEN